MKLSEIKLNPANPRKIEKDKLQKLVKSIKEFPKMMLLRPIIIDDEGTILGGNMRYKALQELGYKEIPDEWVKKASELTEEEKQRFIITDNVQLGAWDWDMLEEGWDKELLVEWGLDIQFHDDNKLNIGEVEIEGKSNFGNMTKCPKCGFEWKQ